MSNSKFITEWNNIIQFKIKNNDLVKPNEAFVFNALLSYLEKFNFDTSSLISQNNSDDAELKRACKVKLCHYIDHLYKVSQKSNEFVYIDLVQPSSKKTAHMLKTLLNYLHYYNMVKADVVQLAESKILELEDVISKRDKLIADNKRDKIKVESIEKTIDKHLKLLPTLNEEIENRTSEEKEYIEQIKQIEETLKNYDSMLTQLKNKEEELRNDVVSEKEVKSLLANKISLQKSIAEQEEIEQTALSNNQEHAEFINNLEPILNHIKHTMEQYPIDFLISGKQQKSTFDEIQKKFTDQSCINQKEIEQIKIFSDKLQELDNSMINKNLHLESIFVENENESKALLEKFEIEAKKSHKLQTILADCDKKISDLIETRQFMFECTENMFKKIIRNE